MSVVLIAGDAPSVLDQVKAAIEGPDIVVRRLSSGREVLGSIKDDPPDLVILDSQIGSMGGVAVSIQLSQEAGAGRIDALPVMLLLDRDADEWLAGKSDAHDWVVKPIDVFELRAKVEKLLAPVDAAQ